METGELVVQLRTWAQVHPYGSMERRLFHHAADRLEAGGSRGEELGAGVVEGWLLGRGVKLLPWQKKKLGVE